MPEAAARLPIVSMIAAHDPNLLIGRNGGTPWKLSEDLKHFKRTTLGHPLLMGRKTFQEIGEKPLPKRPCFVLTSRNYARDDVTTFGSINEALAYFKTPERTYEKLFIIGGGEIYRQFLPLADELVISELHEAYEGDTFFPDYRPDIGRRWQEDRAARVLHEGFTIKIYRRL